MIRPYFFPLLVCLLGPSALAAQSLFQPSGANFYVLQKGTQQFILRQSRMRSAGLDRTASQLASGERIPTAALDAAGLAVAEQMDSLVRGLQRESMNAADFRNYLRHVEGAIAQNQQIVQRIREIVVRNSGGIMGPEDREIAQNEIDQLLAQIDMHARFSEFNKKLVIADLTAESLGLRRIDLVRRPFEAAGHADAALARLSRGRVLAGVKDNALTFRIEGQAFYLVNAVASMSRISDTDMSEAMSEFQKGSVITKTQNGVLMMARPQ